MTEDEAKTKWCPFARAVFGADGYTTQTFNRFLCNPDDKEATAIAAQLGESKGCKCIADECMAWRRSDPYEFGEGYCGLVP